MESVSDEKTWREEKRKKNTERGKKRWGGGKREKFEGCPDAASN